MPATEPKGFLGFVEAVARRGGLCFSVSAIRQELVAMVKREIERMENSGLLNGGRFRVSLVDRIEGPPAQSIYMSAIDICHDGEPRVTGSGGEFVIAQVMAPFSTRGGWPDCVAMAAMGRDKFLARRCADAVEAVSRADLEARALHRWRLPPALAALRESRELAIAIPEAAREPSARPRL